MASRCARILAAVALVVGLGNGARLMASTREAGVKAAYVYKLVSFVRWPPAAYASAATPTTLCIAGGRDVLAALTEMVKGQRVDERPLAVVALPPDSAATAGCHVLYLGEGSRVGRQLAPALDKAPILVISDREAGRSGGAIELVDRGDTIRFVVHRADADRRGLTLSSKLLAVAEAVEQ